MAVAMIERVRGIYHFLADRVPGGLPQAPPRPRPTNIWQSDGMPLVSKVTTGNGLKAAVVRSLDLLGGLQRMINQGETVMVKPNYNSPDPFPASTDLEFLEVVIRLLQECEAKVLVGESSGGLWRPSRNTLARAGVTDVAARTGVDLIVFEDHPRDWVTVKVPGDHLQKVTVPLSAYEAGKIVYLPCMKTHRLARFSLSLKLAMGLMHPGERRGMHMGNLESKIAEINLALQPDLILMDGRKAFVTGGPDKGDVVEPGVIMASGDMVAVDIEALKVILAYKAENRLPSDPWESSQIVSALEHRLGPQAGEYRVIEEAGP